MKYSTEITDCIIYKNVHRFSEFFLINGRWLAERLEMIELAILEEYIYIYIYV